MSAAKIPAAAVEAAAKASFQFMEERPWTCVDPDEVDFFRDAARKALEAAAPHMLAEPGSAMREAMHLAWEQGMEAMHETTGGEWPLIHEANPYRPTP